MNDELRRPSKERTMAYFKCLSQHLHGGPQEKHENILSEPLPSSGGRESNSGYPTKDLRLLQQWL
jgi:hypothetical protein